MLVKCRVAGNLESDMSANWLMATTRQFGKETLEELRQDTMVDPDNITIQKDEAMVLVGGRQSIMKLLQENGDNVIIKGSTPMMVGVFRKHHMFGKNETCVKIVSGRKKLPEDGVKYEDLGNYVQSARFWMRIEGDSISFPGQATVKPSDLALALQRMFK